MCRIFLLIVLFACFSFNYCEYWIHCRMEIVGTVTEENKAFVQLTPNPFNLNRPCTREGYTYCSGTHCHKGEGHFTVYTCAQISHIKETGQCAKMCEDMLAVTECMTKTGMEEAACNNSQIYDPNNFEKLYGGYTCDMCIFGEQYKANSNEHFKLYSPTGKPLTTKATNELEIFVPINVSDPRSGTACISPKSLFIVVSFAILAIIGARFMTK